MIWKTLIIVGLWLIASAISCAHRPPLDGFEGTWGSSELAYEIQFHGPIGLAAHARAAGLQDGDPVFRLVSLDGRGFTARQLFADGGWRTVTGERKHDGKLYCSDGVKNWVMERR